MTTANPSRLSCLLRGIGALIVLAAVVAGVPVLLASLHMVPHSVPSLHQIGQDLKQRDDGQLAAVVIAAGVWICWALFTVSLIPEILAAARKRPARLLPGLAVFQRPAGVLVSAIAVGFTIAPLIAGVATSARADASPPPLPVASASHTPPPTGGSTSPARADDAGHAPRDAAAAPLADATTPSSTTGPTYRVQQRDTLWKIAEDHLGDPMRYPEIIRLNRAAVGPDNELTPGTVLRLPSDATGVAGHDSKQPAGHSDVLVQPGDTLWDIEQRVTGSGANWRAGWEANQGRVEPGGERFTDPNLIQPGWTLSIPTDAPAAAPPAIHRPSARSGTGTRPSPTTTPRRHSEPTDPPTNPAPASPPATSTPAASTPAQRHDEQAAGDAAARSSSGYRYENLAVGGGLLAAVGVAAVMVHRRRKFRRRRLGHIVASLPEPLMPLEQALFASGRPALAKMTFLDLALRNLADLVAREPAATLPDVIGAAVNDEYLELYLAAAAGVPPEPWLTIEPTRWTLSRTANLDAQSIRRVAPYPCLVSIGYTDDGTEYLLDLEHAGALTLRGDTARCVDLARYMAAELANNVWSDHLTVTVAGFAQELVDANPTRVAHTSDAHAAAQELTPVAIENREVAGTAGIDVLDGRLHGTAGDVWMPQVLLAAPGVLDDLQLPGAAGEEGRSAVAVVLTAARDSALAPRQIVTVTDHGELVTSLLPVGDLRAFGLPAEDAADIAQAIALDRDGAVDEPTPGAAGDRPWHSFTDASGALLPEYTVPRAPSGPTAIDSAAEATGPTSCVLPGPDELYLDAAATTAEDLAVLAPAVTAETRSAVEQADPELDELVAAWFDPAAQVAKLDVLGPVKVTAHGRPPAKQLDFCVEIVVYLWMHPNGVSTDQFANDLWPDKNYVGTDSYPKDMASRVRTWLGANPRTGTEYMPRARRGSVDRYRIDGLLVSYDLFCRLRARGEARGTDGLPDLITALKLVSGAPLSMLREFGYGWLPAGQEYLYAGAVLEMAHLVATWALEAGDNAEAIRACEVALTLDAEDDRALLSMAKAHENAGRQAERDATILRLKSLEDPPERTLEVMRRNGWLAKGA
jgi:nucleoid-associated protein YgaU